MVSYTDKQQKKPTPTYQRKVLRDAVKTITDIAIENALYTDKITETYTDFPDYLSEADFGAVRKFYQRNDDSIPKPGEKTHFELQLHEIANARTKNQRKEAAEFLLDTLVEFSDALTVAERDIQNNPSIPDNHKFHFPKNLMEKIANSEDQLNDLIEALSIEPKKSR